MSKNVQCVVVSGSLEHGIVSIVGPFPNFAAAEAYAQQDDWLDDNTPAHVWELIAPPAEVVRPAIFSNDTADAHDHTEGDRCPWVTT